MKNIIKGTPEQFMQAVEDKISELGGRDTISQSVDIQAAASPLSPSGELTSVISTLIENVGSRLGDTSAYLCNMGDGNTIVIYEDDNSGDVCGMTDSQMFYGADSVIDVVLSSWGKATPVESAVNTIESAADTDLKEERYIHSLIGELETRLEEALSEDTDVVVDSVLFAEDSHNLYVTVAYDGNAHEYIVPYADLKFDWDDMQSDISYVINAIVSDVSAQPTK